MKHIQSLFIFSLFIFAVSCTSDTAKDKYQVFAEFAKVNVKPKSSFRNENTLAYLQYGQHRERKVQVAGWLPFFLAGIVPFDERDTTPERIKYIVRNAGGIYFKSYRQEGKATGFDERNRDTVNWRLQLLGQHVIQQPRADAPYILATFGLGIFNTLVLGQPSGGYDSKDTMAYIPNRLSARFYLIANRLFSEGKLDSCAIVMDKILRFIPLDNGHQYWELVNTGREPYLADTLAMRNYIAQVKAEEGL